jgi:hypothetical protein
MVMAVVVVVLFLLCGWSQKVRQSNEILEDSSNLSFTYENDRKKAES